MLERLTTFVTEKFAPKIALLSVVVMSLTTSAVTGLKFIPKPSSAAQTIAKQENSSKASENKQDNPMVQPTLKPLPNPSAALDQTATPIPVRDSLLSISLSPTPTTSAIYNGAFPKATIATTPKSDKNDINTNIQKPGDKEDQEDIGKEIEE